MWYRIPGILHSLPDLHIFLVITKRALASWSNWEFYEQKLQIMHFLQNWNLPVNAMIFGPTRKLSGSFHVSLNKLPKGWMVIGDLMSHAYWYKSMRFIEVTCFGENKILGDMSQHCTKEISLLSASSVFPISLLGNSSLSELCH